MLIRRSLSGKHILIWIGALLVVGILLAALAWLLKGVLHRPTLLAVAFSDCARQLST